MHILLDCDWCPSVIVDGLACSGIQNMTATAPKFSNRSSIFKEDMKELIPKVLLLSCNYKKMKLVKGLFFGMTILNTLYQPLFIPHHITLGHQVLFVML